MSGQSLLATIARMKRLVAIAVALLSLPSAAQFFESQPPPKDEPRPAPYLTADPVDFRGVLPGPPARGSVWEQEDGRLVDLLQGVSPERFHRAELDAEFLYPRFSEAFGRDINRKQAPQTVRLLNRAMRDVAFSTFQAKEHFLRSRPYQNVQLKRICGEEKAPPPEANPKDRSSYPSGHSSYGWAVAMILATLVPERAEQLLRRAAGVSSVPEPS